MRKHSTHAVLTWLYFKNQGYLDQADLPLLLPSLSKGGVRSLLSLLVRDKLVEKLDPSLMGEMVPVSLRNSQTLLQITNHGVELLRSQFSAFQFQDTSSVASVGSWSVIAFLESPKSDAQFRYLRSYMQQIHAGQLKPGMYLYPGHPSEQLLSQLRKLYVGSVVVLRATEWLFGDERTVVSTAFPIYDTAQLYSGISKEISQLLASKGTKKGLSNEDKVALFTVFNRFMSILGDDPGITHWYYPHVPTAAQLVSRFHDVYCQG